MCHGSGNKLAINWKIIFAIIYDMQKLKFYIWDKKLDVVLNIVKKIHSRTLFEYVVKVKCPKFKHTMDN